VEAGAGAAGEREWKREQQRSGRGRRARGSDLRAGGLRRAGRGRNARRGELGTIPTALQQLPAGATLCGTASTGDSAADFGYTYLLSDLSGTALSSFYSPLVAQISGCSTLTAVAGSYSFTCPNNGQGLIVPAPAIQILELGYTSN